MNLGAIRTRAKQRYREAKGVVIPDSDWTDAINAAYAEFLILTRWPFAVANVDLVLTAETRLVTGLTSTQLGGIEAVFDVTNQRELIPEPPLDWQFRYFIGETFSEPVFYKIVGAHLVINPAPNMAITLRVYYFADPILLVLDADTPTIPARYHEALVVGAVYRAYADDSAWDPGAADRRELFLREFDRFVALAREEFVKLARPTPEPATP